MQRGSANYRRKYNGETQKEVEEQYKYINNTHKYRESAYVLVRVCDLEEQLRGRLVKQ